MDRPREQEFTLTITPACSGQRLDIAVASQLKGRISRSQLLETLQSATRNGQPAKPGSRVKEGERITLRLLIPPPFAGVKPEPIPLEVVYEDPHILIINKPFGMPVHPSHGHPGGTLVNALLHRFPDLPGEGIRPGIIHRLDKDTAGLIICAKNDEALREMTALFKNRTIEKEYTAIIKGFISPQEGIIEAPLGRHPRNRKKQAVVNGGKPARTGYTTETRFSDASLLKIRLYTGRTHQIRVHLAHVGCPILGDPIYSRASGGFSKLCLAATALSFHHPIIDRPVACSIPPPDHIQDAISSLKSQST